MNKWASGIPRSKCFHTQVGDEMNKGEQPVKCKLSSVFWIRHWGKFLFSWFLAPSSLWQRGHCWQDERFSKTVALLIHSNLWNLGHAKFACSGWTRYPCLKLTACQLAPENWWSWETILSFFGVNCPFQGANCSFWGREIPRLNLPMGKLAPNLESSLKKKCFFLDQGILQENALNGGSGSIVILQ